MQLVRLGLTGRRVEEFWFDDLAEVTVEYGKDSSDTLYGIFPYVVPCLILLNWVASKTSAQIRS